MGILNNSPDSFHEENVHQSTEVMVSEAERMIEAGAEIIDIGAESNKPDAELISSEEEIERLEPAVAEISKLDCLVSVDTWKADVARAAIESGADIINDISGLDDPEMSQVAAEYDVPIVIGHSTTVLADFGENAEYDHVVEEVIAALEEAAETAVEAGVPERNVIIDPGINFGKDATDSVQLIARLEEFAESGYPILMGHSRKIKFVDAADDSETSLPATVALTSMAVERGADIVRVHDVPENFEALRAAVSVRQLDPKY
jgi:dihydropteroate synthase